MNRSFIDASVLFEIVFVRLKHQECAAVLEDTCNEFLISALTVHLTYHFCEKYKVEAEPVQKLLDGFEILPIDDRAVRKAQERFSGKDFEDCLQAACAELGGCDEIVTLDKQFKKYSGTKLPVRAL